MNDVYLQTAKLLIKAWEKGGFGVRIAIALSGLVLGMGLLLLLAVENSLVAAGWDHLARSIAIALAVAGAVVELIVVGVEQSKEEVLREKKIQAVEKRAQDNPKETQAAWELARVKLESYLDRNLSQVRSIFWMTAFVMICGFALIGTGAYKAFTLPADKFNASLLTSVSGVVVSFIGGTFLILYKSTMAQAKDYVTVLERINAVGMSVQILEALNDGGLDIKFETTADIARQLLLMYSMEAPRAKSAPRKPKAKAVEA